MKDTLVTSELRLFFNFTWRDWSATIIPSLIVATCAVQHASLPAWNVVRFIPWIVCYVYFFDLSNQIVGIEEDRINKPDRPLPSGQITIQGAKRRWAIVLAAFLCIALLNAKLIAPTFTWVAMTAFLSLTPFGGHWFWKNAAAIGVGTWTLLNGVYSTVAEATPLEKRIFAVIAVWAAPAAQIQDIRDIDGDRAIGRKTLPIVAGAEQSRWLISFVCLPFSYAVLWAGGLISAAPVSLTAGHTLLAYRVLRGADARYDHKTYMVSCPVG